MSLRDRFVAWGLVEDGRPYESNDFADGDSCARRQLELSRQLTRLVDVLYALVLVQGAVYYRTLFTIEHEFAHPPRFLPVSVALILIYFMTIQSFVDYHLASEDQPYQLLTTANRRYDLWRFYLDIVIVGSYSFLLLKCHVLILSPSADLAPVFGALALIFLLYILWGTLRRASSLSRRSQPYSNRLLVLIFGSYLLLTLIYTQITADWVTNLVFVAISLALVVLYRWINWSQNRFCE
jgi:hypothetical protein